MKILLVVYDNDAHVGFFPMGVAALIAYGQKHGLRIDVYHQDIHHWPDDHLTQFLNEHKYDVVGLSFIGAYYPYRKAKAISKAVRAAKNRVIYMIGGHGPSPEPEYFIRLLDADICVLGEGEETLVELTNALASESSLVGIEGIAYRSGDEVFVNSRRSPIADIDRLPFPAYDRFPMEIYRLRKDAAHLGSVGNRFSVPMLSGRGCKFHCNFCYRMDEGMRLRSPEAVVDEMNWLFHRWNITHFMFYDDLLMESEKRIADLCETFIRKGPPNMSFICQGRLNYATPDALKLMKRAGCVYIYYGIESYNNDMLKVMRKALTTDIIKRGVRNTGEAGINFSPNMIFGNIGETEQHLQNSLLFLLKYDDCVQLRAIKPVTPYPGSPLYDYAIRNGMLKGAEDFYENKHVNTDLLTVNFTPMSDDRFYSVLRIANRLIMDNYYGKFMDRQYATLRRLYKDRDASFRGFRHI